MAMVAKMAALVFALLAMSALCAPSAPVTPSMAPHADCHEQQDAPPADRGPARHCCAAGCPLMAAEARLPLIVLPVSPAPLLTAAVPSPPAGRALALDPPPPRRLA